MRGLPVVLLLVMTTSAAVAGDSIATDTSWWNSLSDEAKAQSTVTGTIAYDSGLYTGYNEGMDDQIDSDSATSKAAWGAVLKSDARYAKDIGYYNNATTASRKSLALDLLVLDIQNDLSNATPTRKSFRPGANFRGRTIGELEREMDALYTHHRGDASWDYSVAIECLDANLKKREFPYGKCGLTFNS
jgi:hypothetical protein